ncbi:MAG: tetratricopeptide repeat protein [Planctomycetota bacterium]
MGQTEASETGRALIEECQTLRKAGDTPTALARCRAFLAREPHAVGVLRFAGICAAELGELDAATQYLEQATGLAPQHSQTHNNLGNVRKLRGESAAALASYARAAATDPENALAHFNHGLALYEAKDYAAAEASYARAIALKPTFADAHNNRGLALRRMLRADDALASYQRAIELQPRHAEAYENLGAIYRDRDDSAQASQYFERAIELDPRRDHLRHIIASMAGITTQAPPPRYIEHLFDRFADDFDKTLTEELEYRAPSAVKSVVVRHAPPARRFANAVDLGCGTGLCGVELRPLCEKLLGIDLSTKMLDGARAKHIYDELVQGELVPALADTHATFDLFTAADVFVYLGDLVPIFARVAAQSRPGALFAFTTEISNQQNYELQPNGRYAHARDYVESLAAGAGFARVECERVDLRLEHGAAVPGFCYLFRKD